LQNSDIVFLQGSKNTIADLIDIRKRGFVNEILKAKESGKKVVGICGGYQMMGQEILDPNGVEGDVERVEGLGLLPTVTVLETSKVTEQCTFYYKGSRNRSYGYEIHMGSTQFTDKSEHVNVIDNRGSEGCMVSEKCWGSYIHGIFDNDDVINDLLSGFSVKPVLYNHDKYKQEQYDNLAAHVRSYCDMDMIYKILKPE
jgi:adenosylcobyric acid synthase